MSYSVNQHYEWNGHNSYQSLLWTVTFFLFPPEGLRSWLCSDWTLHWLFAHWPSAPCPPMFCSVSITRAGRLPTTIPTLISQLDSSHIQPMRDPGGDSKVGRGKKPLFNLPVCLSDSGLSLPLSFSLSPTIPFPFLQSTPTVAKPPSPPGSRSLCSPLVLPALESSWFPAVTTLWITLASPVLFLQPLQHLCYQFLDKFSLLKCLEGFFFSVSLLTIQVLTYVCVYSVV